MKKIKFCLIIPLSLFALQAGAQYRDDAQADVGDKGDATLVLTLDKALEIALSENISVKVADKEVERTEYAKKGTYASLYPKIDASGSFQRTIKKQVMYMDITQSSSTAQQTTSGTQSSGEQQGTGATGQTSSGTGIEVGRYNTWSAGLSASVPLVNAQLWKSLEISGLDVELAVEKARASRLDMVTQVKQAYYTSLLAKQSFEVYKEVYENAVKNFEQVERKYNAQKASEVEYLRSKTNVSNSIPYVFNAESAIILALWQLKAVIGMDLDTEIDVVGSIDDYSETMFRDLHSSDSLSLDNNSTMRQLALQAEELAKTIKMQIYANIPTLALSFNYNYNAMSNDFNFSQYKWNPYSYVGVSLSIPIFNGGKRRSDIRQAQNRYDQLKLQTVDTERQLKISIRNSLTTMEMNMKSYYAAEDAVISAKKSYDIVEKSYEIGRSTLTDLNDAQLSLTQSRLTKSQAVYDFVVAKAQLEQTLGADFTE